MAADLIHADGRTDKTKLIGAFRDYVQGPKTKRMRGGNNGCVEGVPRKTYGSEFTLKLIR